jgi:hypothetical protein
MGTREGYVPEMVEGQRTKILSFILRSQLMIAKTTKQSIIQIIQTKKPHKHGVESFEINVKIKLAI